MTQNFLNKKKIESKYGSNTLPDSGKEVMSVQNSTTQKMVGILNKFQYCNFENEI